MENILRNIKSLFKSAIGKIESIYKSHFDYTTYGHIVVFESDDWGSIRMSNRKYWEELLRMGYAVDKRPYERFDTLESPDDLSALFDVLSKHKDMNGNHPIITANMLMTNPDFENIEKSGFQEYHYESISDTYRRYYGDTRVLELMRQGIDEGLFMPQSHGREHFNVEQWMIGLRNGNEDLLTAFRHGMCGIAPKLHPDIGNKIMNALLAQNDKEQEEIDRIVSEGLILFEKQWGFKSKSFVAPCYLWDERTEQTLSDGGVEMIQTQRGCKAAYKSPSRKFYAGQKNGYGQIYNIRNCFFEPSTSGSGTSVDGLIAQVDNTFSMHKIAVFSTHRINYVGGIDEQNRKRTLNLLDYFLTKLLKKYPDTVFLSSDKLIEIYNKK